MDLPRLVRRVPHLLRAYPVTVVTVVACLALGLVLGGGTAREAVGYGLPAAEQGQWWRFAVGAFVSPALAWVPLLVAAVGGVVGLLEHRVGSRRTAVTLVVTHLAGALGAAALLALGSGLPWPWADALAQRTDVGPSAAGFGALAVLAGTCRPVTRRLLVTGVGAYLVAMLWCSGLLWDLEHLVAFGAGLALAGGRVRHRQTSTLGRVRIGTALLVLAVPLAGLVQAWFPGAGGVLGSGASHRTGSVLAAGVAVLGALVLADGVRRGARWAWRALPVVGLGGLLAWPLGAGWSAGTVTALLALPVLALMHRRVSTGSTTGKTGSTTVPSGSTTDVVPEPDVRAALREHGGGSLGWQHTWVGAESWTDGLVRIGFRRSAGVAIVVGDPIGPRFGWYAASRAFVEHCRDERLVPCWYAVSTAFLREAGLEDSAVRIGEDAVVDLPGLELRGKAWQDVRTARNRAHREGVEVVTLDPRDPDVAVLRGVEQVAQAWADDKPLPEMGFTLGGLREALDPDVRVLAAVDADGQVHGVVSWLPVHAEGRVVGWTLDLMRRRDDGFRPVVELLVAESLLTFRDEGCATASLSVAPLARTGAAAGVLEHLLDRAGGVLEPVYGFGSLLAFKQKFSPRLVPVHLAHESPLDLPRIAVAVGRAYLPHLSWRDTVAAVRALRRPTPSHEQHARRPEPQADEVGERVPRVAVAMDR